MGIKSEILSVVRGNGPMTIAEIAAALDRPKSTWLRETLENMHLSNLLNRGERRSGAKPAITYEWRNPRKMTPRQEWQRDCEMGLVLDYQTWLEEKYKELS